MIHGSGMAPVGHKNSRRSALSPGVIMPWRTILPGARLCSSEGTNLLRVQTLGFGMARSGDRNSPSLARQEEFFTAWSMTQPEVRWCSSGATLLLLLAYRLTTPGSGVVLRL